MNKKTLLYIILISIMDGLKAQPIFTYLSQINATVATIPFIFEGKVTSTEIYPGDDVGNRLSGSNVVWNGNIGYFYDASGKEAQGYSLSKIKICKVYKGSLNVEQELQVLTRSFSIQNIYLLKTGTGTDADTIMRYMYAPTSHEPGVDDQIMLPAADYKKKIYFAKQLNTITPTAYAGKRHYSNAHFVLEMPYNETVDVQNPSGYWEKKTAYCALVPYVFDDQSQLQLFLNQIQTINPNPTDFCRGTDSKEAVSVSELGESQRNVSVYPNPSNQSDAVKIKLYLPEPSAVNIVLTDITGKEIVNKSLGTQKEIDYDLNMLFEKGIYILKVSYINNSQTFKLIKN